MMPSEERNKMIDDMEYQHNHSHPCPVCEHTLDQEHENFLYVHRENMKAVEMILEIEKALVKAKEALDAFWKCEDTCSVQLCQDCLDALSKIQKAMEGK